jgi:hypothetical protein
MIFFGETLDEAVFVLIHSTVKVTGDAGIERSAGAGHNVNVVLVHPFLPLALRPPLRCHFDERPAPAVGQVSEEKSLNRFSIVPARR